MPRPLLRNEVNSPSQLVLEGSDFALVNVPGLLTSYYFQIEPKQLKLGELTYREGELGFDFQPLPRKLIGEYYPEVFLHAVVIDRPKRIRSSVGGHILDQAKANLTSQRGVTINGGFFIVKSNLKNPLTPGLESVDGYPIGYYYNQEDPRFNGTALPFPGVYHADLGVIVVSEDYRLTIMSRDEFMDLHQTELRPVHYWQEGRTIRRMEPVIKMSSDGRQPLMKSGRARYRIAIESGPMLIQDRVVVLTYHRVNTEQMVLLDKASNPPRGGPLDKASNPQLVKVLPKAGNYLKFAAAPDNRIFPYGQRFSNIAQIHNFLAIDQRGRTVVFLIEGRGFDGYGLPRATATEFLSRFNLQTMISLDGGYSANAVIKQSSSETAHSGKNASVFTRLLNDPQNRSLGSTLHFEW